MRVRIAVTVGQSMREVERGVLEGWLNLKGAEFERFVRDVCGWGLDDTQVVGVKGKGGGVVRVPVNKENEAKGTVVREEVRFDREFRVFSVFAGGGAVVGKGTG
jgi:translation initiation factor 3 subunit K